MTIRYLFYLENQEEMKKINWKPTQRWKTNKWCVYNISYHIIWCPKYRRKVLVWEIEKRLKELSLEKAKQLGIKIEKMEVMPDHIHLFIKANPSLSIAHIVSQLKWYTSHILRKEFKELTTKLPTLWTRSYYVETIWHISEQIIKKYIEDQKRK